MGAKSRMRRTETPKPIWIKFGTVVDIPDVVTYTNFGDHRLRGFWVAGGQICLCPIDFHRHPYNTLALPCECVICKYLSGEVFESSHLLYLETKRLSYHFDFCGLFLNLFYPVHVLLCDCVPPKTSTCTFMNKFVTKIN